MKKHVNGNNFNIHHTITFINAALAEIRHFARPFGSYRIEKAGNFCIVDEERAGISAYIKEL